MIENLTPEQMTIFNRVMKSSFYYPIAASRDEPKTNYPTDVITPASVTSFYTQYFQLLDSMYDEDSEIFENISSDNLSAFLSKVASIIQQLDPLQKSLLLDDAENFAKKERAHFEEYGTTLEEHHSIFHTTKMVSQLLRYREAYSWMGYFQDAA